MKNENTESHFYHILACQSAIYQKMIIFCHTLFISSDNWNEFMTSLGGCLQSFLENAGSNKLKIGSRPPIHLLMIWDTFIYFLPKWEPIHCLVYVYDSLCLCHFYVPFIKNVYSFTSNSCADHDCVSLPLDSSSRLSANTSLPCTAKVCGDTVTTADCGETVADWLSAVS